MSAYRQQTLPAIDLRSASAGGGCGRSTLPQRQATATSWALPPQLRRRITALDLVGGGVALDDEPVARWRMAPPLALHPRHARAVEHVTGPVFIAALSGI